MYLNDSIWNFSGGTPRVNLVIIINYNDKPIFIINYIGLFNFSTVVNGILLLPAIISTIILYFWLSSFYNPQLFIWKPQFNGLVLHFWPFLFEFRGIGNDNSFFLLLCSLLFRWFYRTCLHDHFNDLRCNCRIPS